jgi:type II secretion system protein G
VWKVLSARPTAYRKDMLTLSMSFIERWKQTFYAASVVAGLIAAPNPTIGGGSFFNQALAPSPVPSGVGHTNNVGTTPPAASPNAPSQPAATPERAKASSDIANIKGALDRYYLDAGSYPTTDQGLQALISAPNAGNVPHDWSGPYIERIPKDPWGNAYVYKSDGNNYVLKSLGPDGVESADDIDGSSM